MSETDGTVDNELDRDIGLIGAIALGVGTMIAAGIFVLSGLAVSNVGSAAILSFVLAGIVAGFTALAYAEFSALYPESGGGYAYVANVFDSNFTYLVGWSIILGYPASAAFYLASFSSWFERFLYPALRIPQAIPFWVSGVLVLGLLILINLKGTEETGMFQIVVTALKVGLILLFLYGGLQAIDVSVIRTSFAQNVTQFAEIGVTTTLVFITFFGFEAIATNAEEIERPGKNIPRAIFISMGLVSLIYALVVLVIVLAINDQTFLARLVQQVGEISGIEAAREYVSTHGEVSMAYASKYYLGNIGFYVIIVGALLSMISAANATILAGSRVKLAMSRRGHLPSVFGDLSDRFNTPYASVLLTGGLVLFYIFVFSVIFGTPPNSEGGSTLLGIHLGLHSIAHFADFMLLFGLIFVNIALIRSRQKEPDLDRQFEVPLVPWIPIVAILANLVLVTQVETTALLLGILAEAIGVVAWFGWIRQTREEHTSEAVPTIAARSTVTEHERDEQILVPIAQTENVPQLMRTAIDIARDRDAELVVMSAVTVPEQTPLHRAREFGDDQEEIVSEAISIAEEAGVPVHGIIPVGHHPEEIILHTLDQHDSDGVLMGWSGSDSRDETELGSTVDDVVRHADADVFVERIGPAAGEDVDSILVPTAGGPHAKLAADLASAIARSEDATCSVVHVVDDDQDSDRADAQQALEETIDDVDDSSITTDVIHGADTIDRLVEESERHDMTIVGATRESRLSQILFGSVPERLGQQTRNVTIMVKRQTGTPQRVIGQLRRWVSGD